jgi:type II secretory pathway pseudopilin PulG
MQLNWATSGITSDKPNAAWVYRHAFQTFRMTKDEEAERSELPSPRENPAAYVAFARKVIPRNEYFFSLLEEASRIRDCAFPRQWDAGAAIVLPEPARMREAARWLSVRAEILASDGKGDEALASYAITLRMGEHAKTDPVLIGQLVAYALQSIVCESLQKSLSVSLPSPEACHALYQQIGVIDQVRPSVRSVQGERVLLGMWVYDYLRRHALQALRAFSEVFSPEQREQRWVGLYLTFGRPLFNLDEIAYLGFTRQLAAAFAKPWPDSQRVVKEVEQAARETPAYRGLLAKMVVPEFDGNLISRESKTALLGAAQIALAAKAYRAEHGAYPASLAQLQSLGWKLPLDNFNHQPYHYRRQGPGFLAWSVGPDMKDDGGKPWRSGMELEEKGYDIVFRCER